MDGHGTAFNKNDVIAHRRAVQNDVLKCQASGTRYADHVSGQGIARYDHAFRITGGRREGPGCSCSNRDRLGSGDTDFLELGVPNQLACPCEGLYRTGRKVSVVAV